MAWYKPKPESFRYTDSMKDPIRQSKERIQN